MKTLILDGSEVAFDTERNVLELARKAGIDIPTFCYHSELSVYGACRMCLVEIEGQGIVTSCTTPPAAGMNVRTNTAQIRSIRRINLELLLASHERECTTCGKSGACTLQSLSRKMGIDSIRFATRERKAPLDLSSPALVRDPNKCVLCGDCVRVCEEIQGIGAIDFAYRGSEAAVLPAFGKALAEVDCVNCGQCARVCPTGAIMPREEIAKVWETLDRPGTVTVAQVAPAIRVALGEHFGLPPGTVTTGKLIAALRRLGFARVYDTCFTADMTVLEEGDEFLRRLENKERLPLLTSCCPAWVTFVEQNGPDLLPNLSTCKSPQQMFGAIAKHLLPAQLGVKREALRVVSIMPCTAKKYEARRPEFSDKAGPEVDHVLTTRELARMIEASGLRFADLDESPFDMPFGLTSGAGVLFGASGGVTEAVVRYVYEKIEGKPFDTNLASTTEDEHAPVREYELTVGGATVKMAVVYGLAAARTICEQVKAGTCKYHLIEVMACPGGCINGAGQPVARGADIVAHRKRAIRAADRSAPVRAAQHNPALTMTYGGALGDVGGPMAHHLLHTRYKNRKRIDGASLDLGDTGTTAQTVVEICLGTNCCLYGAHDLLKKAVAHVEENGLAGRVAVRGAFCYERCGQSPVVRVGDRVIEQCTFEQLIGAIGVSAGAAV